MSSFEGGTQSVVKPFPCKILTVKILKEYHQSIFRLKSRWSEYLLQCFHRDGKHCLFGFQSWVYSVLSVMVLSSKWGQKSVEDYILSAKITFFRLRSCFWPACIFLPWSCDPVLSPDQKPRCLPEPKERSWPLHQGNPGLWSHQKYQVCGRIKYFPYTLKLGR